MNSKVKDKYNSYPSNVKKFALQIRKIILEVAKDTDIDFIGEDLKWGEPSFLTKKSGSTFRLDWKKKTPEHLSLFFNCRTKLISTFKEMYPEDFEYVGNREFRLPINQKFSITKFKKCIEIAFKYNLLKKDL